MSYILEALKKVEQKQQREGIPRLLTLPPDVPEEEKKSRVLPYVISGALILNALVMMIWWIAPWQRRETITPVIDSASVKQKTSSETQEKVSAPPVYNHAPGKSSSAQTSPETFEKVAPSPLPAPASNGEGTSGRKEKAVASNVNQPSEAQSRKEAKHASTASGARLYELRELPPRVRDSLPGFKISGHAYSPESRFRVARVNNKIVQEGEALSQGLRVDEIVPEGVILSYQGYRFRVGINDNP